MDEGFHQKNADEVFSCEATSLESQYCHPLENTPGSMTPKRDGG